LETIIALLQSVQARSVLEFGVNEGRTARAILDNMPSIELYQGIDVEPGYKFACPVQNGETPAEPGRMAKGDPRFKLFVRKNGSLDLGIFDLDLIDAAFIDGDHSYDVVQYDTRLARSLLRKGRGLIIWHDYHFGGTVGVPDALHEMVGRGHDIKHINGTWLAIERCG
jgi:predicted O-methyltransferase YrrM